VTVITKLEARGFKSFAKKTEIDLLPGFNCVLGPNGNGKCCLGSSNIIIVGEGFVKIGELVEQEIKKYPYRIKRLKDGIYVDGFDKKIVTINPFTFKQEQKIMLFLNPQDYFLLVH